MNIKGNIIIFSTDNEARKDVRRLKEKKLQIVLNEKNEFPKFEVNNKTYIKDLAEKKVEELFGTSKFYIEQLYTWGDPKYYTKNDEILITYLVVINKNDIGNMGENIAFYDINITNNESEKLQNVTLSNEYKTIKYDIKTTRNIKKNSIEYTNELVEKSNISELTAIIIHTGIKRLRNRIQNTNIAFNFLDKEFAISEIQQIYEIILDKKLVAANFRKKIEPMVKKTDIIVKESAFRPSNRYTFNYDYLTNWV